MQQICIYPGVTDLKKKIYDLKNVTYEEKIDKIYQNFDLEF